MVQVDSPTATGGGFIVAEQHQDFLRGLGFDEELRAALVADPAATLERFGIHVDPASLPETVTLPSADELRRSPMLAGLDKSVLMAWLPFLPLSGD